MTAAPDTSFSALAWNAGTDSYGVVAEFETFIYKNNTGSFAYGIEPGKVSLESDWGNAAVRWTAPSAGQYLFNIAVGGSKVSGGGGFGNNFAQSAAVKVNGLTQTETFSSDDPDVSVKQWSFTVSLAGGSTVDTFVLNPGFAGGGNTQTDISVSSVPEPGAAWLARPGRGPSG